MQHGAIVDSVGASRQAIGGRAARHIDLAFRHFMLGQGAVLGDGFLRVITGEPHPLGNAAIVSDPASLETTQDAIGPLLGRDFPTAMLYPEGVSESVAASLAGFGFAGQGEIPAMAVDIDRMAGTSLPRGYDWARIGAGDDARAWTTALANGYGLPHGLARMFSPEAVGADMAPDAQVHFYAIRRNGQFVATSLLFLADGLAGIYCVATLPEERGKGLGAHATAEALRVARRLGYRVGVLQSSTEGHPVYIRLGFEDFGGVPMFVRMPA
jgi:GNAT superfamily N-acetyltransferase